jgi:hypothetical protein
VGSWWDGDIGGGFVHSADGADAEGDASSL